MQALQNYELICVYVTKIEPLFFMIGHFLTFFTDESHFWNIMFLHFLQKIISFRVDETMEQAVVNRVRRINIYYLILITMLCFSILYSYLADVSSMSLINGIVLALAVAAFLFLPVGAGAT